MARPFAHRAGPGDHLKGQREELAPQLLHGRAFQVRAGVEIHVLGQQLEETLAGGHHLMVGTKGKLVIEPLPVVK